MSYRNSQFLLVFILFTMGMFSCAEEDLNAFLINGKELISSETEPKDSSGFLTINIGDTVTIQNLTDGHVESRKWDVDGDGKWDKAFENKVRFSTIMRKAGKRKISLSINGSKKKVSKWIDVVGKDRPTIVLADPMMPSFNFESPFQKFNVTNKKNFTIEAKLENIFEDDNLRLLVNDKVVNFDLDEESGRLIKEIRLKKGENNIELKATVDDELITSFVTIDYDPSGEAYIADIVQDVEPKVTQPAKTTNTKTVDNSYVQTPTPKPIKQPVEPEVKRDLKPKLTFLSPSNNSTTNKAKQRIEIKTEHIPSKRYLSVSLGGKEIKGITFSATSQTASMDIDLAEGENDIVIIGQNDFGITQSKVKVNYSPKTVVEVIPETKSKPIEIIPDPVEIIPDPAENEIDIVEPVVEKVALKIGNSYALAGLSTGDFYAGCSKGLNGYYIFYITPKQPIELSEFTVWTDNCGGLEVVLESASSNNKMKAALVNGKNQVVLNDLNHILQPGVRYTITCKPISGYGNCNAKVKPKLLDIAECNKKSKYTSHMKTDFLGKSVIYKLEYRY